ncbi:hypothetical protein H4217_009267, partial [Coemansia sp. RSA 1939]
HASAIGLVLANVESSDAYMTDRQDFAAVRALAECAAGVAAAGVIYVAVSVARVVVFARMGIYAAPVGWPNVANVAYEDR